jgi:hypothetical protein
MIRTSLKDWEENMMGEPYLGPIELRVLPPLETPAIDELRKEIQPALRDRPIVLHAFRAVAGERKFLVGFTVWRHGPTAAANAIIERLVEADNDKNKKDSFAIRLIKSDAEAKTIALLRRFKGKLLLIGYQDDRIYDDGVCGAMKAPGIAFKFDV